MPRPLTLILLTASPVVISAGLAFLGFFVHSLGRAFGSRQPPTAIVVALLAIALLHAGYYLGPFLWLNGRATLALWLMTPVAVVVGLIGLAILAKIMPAASESESNARWFYRTVAAGFVMALAYAGPLLIMLVGARAVTR